MVLGRTDKGLIKTKTDGGLRAVNCACCNTCPPLACGFVKITNPSIIALLNSATSGSFNYSHGTDSAPSWTSYGPDSFIAAWNCCNHPDGCIHCYDDWEYVCQIGWSGSLIGGCFANVLAIYAFDFPWGYTATPANGQCSGCDSPVESQILINGFQILMGMNFGCPEGGIDFPIYPISINLT